MALILRLTNKFKKLFDNNEHNYDFPILVQLLSKLPEDVLTEILVRVPADVLVLLCPIWRNLISSPLFVDLQLRRADSIHVVQSLYPDGLDRKARLSIVDCTRKKNCIDLMSDHITNKCDRTLWGSCGGLLAFWSPYERGCISIVNPITGENRDIVTPTSLNGRLCGFYFDRFQGRYNLLYADARKSNATDDVYYTFDLSENVWRKLDMIKSCLNNIRPRIRYIPVIVGDALHWLTDFPYSCYCSEMVVVFNIETKELYSLCHPPVNNGGNSISATTTCDYFSIHQSFRQLIAKDGQLCFCQTIVEESVVDLWLLENYENWGSWVKKFKVNLASIHKIFQPIKSRYYLYMPSEFERLNIWSPQNGSNEILVTCEYWSDWKGLYGYNLETYRSRQLEKSRSKIDMDGYIVLPYTKTMLSPMF